MVLEAPARPPAHANPYGDSCRAFTAEDWWAMPEDGNRYELLNGALIVMPAPSFEHQKVALRIAAALLAHADATGGEAGMAPLGVTLSQDLVFEPDAMYVAPQRRHLVGERGIDGAPDLVVEVASPSTARYDRLTKLPAYFEAGVVEVWLVDPEARTVSVVTTAGETTVLFGEPIPSTVVAIGSGGLT